MDEENLSVVRESFGKVTYDHKTYEKAADIYKHRGLCIKVINIILLVATTSSAIGSILQGKLFVIVTSFLAAVSLFFSLWQFNFNYEKQSYEYKRVAKQLWLIREKYQNFIADIMAERFTVDENANKRDLLLEELYKILNNAPNTFPKAYEEARKALKVNEEMTFSVEEIDQFLPYTLRKKKK